MALFDSASEKARLENLRLLEDKRVAFAEKMEKNGFKPEKMLFISTEDGRFLALCRDNGKQVLIVGPTFGHPEEDFIVECADHLNYEDEEVAIKGTGLNGAFGFGTKGASGHNYTFTLSDGSTYTMPVVYGRTSYLEADYRKNPLLKTKRRRNNANMVWDLVPFDRTRYNKVQKAIETYYLA